MKTFRKISWIILALGLALMLIIMGVSKIKEKRAKKAKPETEKPVLLSKDSTYVIPPKSTLYKVIPFGWRVHGEDGDYIYTDLNGSADGRKDNKRGNKVKEFALTNPSNTSIKVVTKWNKEF